ncbi:MAG: hypothetical protein ABF265_03685 [Polaribacter sp.]|jgi:HPt (histidine-containing phosphotransfer) domain-containing protein
MDIEKILNSSIVDTSSLIGYFSSDKDSLIQLILVYLSDTEPRLETLKKNEETLNYETIRSISHFLKSSLGLMGVRCLNEISELEQKAQDKVAEDTLKKELIYQ